MKIIFMGTSSFAVPSLEKLAACNKYEILKVITTPDSVQGRGYKLISPPVKEKSLSLGLPIIQPEKLNNEEFNKEIITLKPDIGIVISFGKILRKPLLSLPSLGCINIHGSLLPKYRGAAPIQWALINGEKETGVTSLFMDEGIDTGDIILQDKISILHEDTRETLHDKLSVLGGEILLKTLELIDSGSFPRYIQDNSQASYARIIKKEDGKIDWSKKSDEIINLIRGMTPWPGTYSWLENKLIKIWDADIYDTSKDSAIRSHKLKEGEIFKIEKNHGIFVASGHGAIIIKVIQPENKKKMSAYDFVLGYRIKPGQKFIS
ncbi:MAG: methionyl-tRNA formyltransferase [Candidatus Firestonebacteria bacterium]|nr:methionyl-tRNA formyltransferase [Candidatus Firestonebacteria bacterium]